MEEVAAWLALVLRDSGIPFVVTEWDHATFRDATAQGSQTVWGDVAQRRNPPCGSTERARVLVLTIPDHSTIRLSVQRARKINPSLIVIARATRERNIAELQELGVDATVQPEFEGGIEMVRRVLTAYSRDEIETSRLISFLRSDLYGEAPKELTDHR